MQYFEFSNVLNGLINLAISGDVTGGLGAKPRYTGSLQTMLDNMMGFFKAVPVVVYYIVGLVGFLFFVAGVIMLRKQENVAAGIFMMVSGGMLGAASVIFANIAYGVQEFGLQ